MSAGASDGEGIFEQSSFLSCYYSIFYPASSSKYLLSCRLWRKRYSDQLAFDLILDLDIVIY
jgi:hypothetical protein